ncbi:hypothetical protein RF55_10699 [Lasius niger]|uniref:CAP-Gly domain-containing protein n=1 Tax=Lasius niger TaxID=67767 RepID=A0A0J7KGV3_LASNI|nr:hypothetical protein RF55_10699 [Lasius niger]
MDHLDVPEKDTEDLSLKSISDGDNSVFSDNVDQQAPRQNQPSDSSRQNEHSENESEELDDIELIFTTDETCRDLGLQEDLVSITETESWQHASAGSGQPVLLKYTKSTDNESLVCNGDKTSSVEEAVSSQSSSIDREESVDRFDESSSTRLNKMWSQCSVLVETDISKCGIVEDAESSTGSSLRHVARRNTLAAPPTTYRPIIHREALASSRRKSSAPLRPVMDRSSGARRESGVQTDISALPAQWRSESYLAHKVAHTFTTLPSKFALPTGVPGRLRLSDKTREARRVMLSDISFTSMVPELSRSADHLCHDPHAQIPRDLKLDHLVKVISPEGRVLQGRVRYVGPVPGREDAHVGVELPYVNGSSDGTFHGRRFFDCEPDRAIFVPFKKVVLAWCTT